MRDELYTKITKQIYDQLQAGTAPWFKPWYAAHTEGRITRPKRFTGEPYNGINILLLWSAAVAEGFCSDTWCTFKQAMDSGGHVRKGEKGTTVVYADKFTKEDDNGNEKTIPFLKSYSVFNTDQCEGLTGVFNTVAAPVDPVERIEHAEMFFKNTGVELRSGGNRAYYSITHDYIQMPPIEAFNTLADFYGTLAHESIHSTRHPSRLNRDFGQKRFGDPAYAHEEIVAEIGSAYIAADLGLEIEARDDHAAYVSSWLKALEEQPRFIFSAASHASKAAEYLNSLQPIHAP